MLHTRFHWCALIRLPRSWLSSHAAELYSEILGIHWGSDKPPKNVRFGSLADILTSPRHVRFTPNNGRWAAHPIKLGRFAATKKLRLIVR